MNTLKDYVNFKLTHADKVAEAEGYPLKMEDCKKYKKMRDLKVYGNSFQSTLPYPYQSVTYIEATGTQYINTRYKPNNTSKIELDIELTKLNGNNSAYEYIPVFGARDLSVSPVKEGFASFSSRSDETIATFVYGTTDNINLTVSGWLSRNLITIDKNNYYFNDDLIMTSTDTSTWQSTVNLVLLTVSTDNIIDARRA